MRTLHVDTVVKRYGDFTAVDHVSFTAEPGRILGVLGPNGAGKSSTIRMVTHITMPDEGRITFGAKEVGPWSQEVMGYLPEERGLYKKLKVGEQIVYFAMLRGLDKPTAIKRMHAWLKRLGASDWAGKKVEELSKGMQQKVQFIATLVHEPELVILDEPFSGLDPINADLLKDVVYEMREQGRTVLFASHRMEQGEELCDDICLINKGKVVLSGGVREVKRSFGRGTVLLEYDGSPSASAIGPSTARLSSYSMARPVVGFSTLPSHRSTRSTASTWPSRRCGRSSSARSARPTSRPLLPPFPPDPDAQRSYRPQKRVLAPGALQRLHPRHAAHTVRLPRPDRCRWGGRVLDGKHG